MKKSELLNAVDHKPKTMGCCSECISEKKDCEPNPLNCIDFCIFNHDTLKKLGMLN